MRHITQDRACAVAALILGLVVGIAGPANARAVQVADRDPSYHGRVRVIEVDRISKRWFHVTMSNGREWVMTRCAYWNSLDCWFDAERRQSAMPYSLRPYVDLGGRTIYAARNVQIDRKA